MSIKISGLPAGTPPTGTELVPAVQAAVTVSLTMAQITAAAVAAASAVAPATVLPLVYQGLHAVDTGAANAYVLTTSVSIGAVTLGQLVEFLPTNNNTGPSTVNVDGQGVKNIVNQYGAALVGGEITVPTWLQWNGTAWQIVGTGALPDKVRTPAEIANATVPTNYFMDPYTILRYVASIPLAINGTNDSTTALQTACNCLALCRRRPGYCRHPRSDAKDWRSVDREL